MKKSIIIILAVLTLGIIVGSSWVKYSNQEVSLRNEYDAQKKILETSYDKMWKTLSQKAQVSNEYKEGFNEIYQNMIAGRYQQGDGSLMKWIQESNPTFDPSLYKDLMASIDSERTGVKFANDRMTDIKREHQDLRLKFPSSLFVGSRQELEDFVISSTKTKKVMETGVDDDVELFN